MIGRAGLHAGPVAREPPRARLAPPGAAALVRTADAAQRRSATPCVPILLARCFGADAAGGVGARQPRGADPGRHPRRGAAPDAAVHHGARGHRREPRMLGDLPLAGRAGCWLGLGAAATLGFAADGQAALRAGVRRTLGATRARDGRPAARGRDGRDQQHPRRHRDRGAHVAARPVRVPGRAAAVPRSARSCWRHRPPRRRSRPGPPSHFLAAFTVSGFVLRRLGRDQHPRRWRKNSLHERKRTVILHHHSGPQPSRHPSAAASPASPPSP